MRTVLSVVLLITIAPVYLWAQVFPKEGSILNYRLIGFSFPAHPQKGSYKIGIASGNCNSEESFKKNIVCTINSKTNRVIVEVPAFGKQYTWRETASDGKTNIVGPLHHFSIGTVPAVDSAVTRLRVARKAEAYKNAYVFLDGTGVLYDMAGHPVWYLPDIGGYKTESSNLRDLKISPYGTITFLYEQFGSYEVDYNGAILWKAPDDGKVSGGNAEYYHHELTRLANGHYMILGCEYESWNRKLPSPDDSSYRIFHTYKMRPDSAKIRYLSMPFGTIIEYDQQGNVVWSWKSSEYFRNSDIYYHPMNEGGIALHENSFYFDEKRNIIYVGFRNISRILRVKYPEGEVLNVYGEIFKPGVPKTGNGLYSSQHSVMHSDNGYLYLYDNNSRLTSSGDSQTLPHIIKLKEPELNAVSSDRFGGLKKIWDYECPVDGIDNNHPAYQFTTGGNVMELADNSLFVNMSNVYSKVFILSPGKKVLWSAIPEKWNEANKKWEMIYDYRASMITDRKDLETLIWNAEK